MLIRLRKAQHTAEYAILWGIVIAAVTAMQHEVRRAIQGTIHRAKNEMLSQIGATEYEPQTGSKTRTTTYSSERVNEDAMTDATDDRFLLNISTESDGTYTASVTQ